MALKFEPVHIVRARGWLLGRAMLAPDVAVVLGLVPSAVLSTGWAITI